MLNEHNIDGKTEALWTKNFIFLILAAFFASNTAQMVSNNFSLYVDVLGGTATYSGSLMLIYTTAALFSRFLSGYLLDHKGRRLIMIVGCILYALSSLSCNLFIFLEILPVFRFFQGVGFSLISTATATAVVDIVPKKRIGEGIGYAGLANSMATATGPSLGLFLIHGNDFTRLFFGSMLMAFLAGLFFVFNQNGARPAIKIENDVQVKKAIIWSFIERDALIPSFIQMIAIIASSSVYFFLTLYAKYNNNHKAGLFFIIVALFMVVARMSAGRLTDRKGALFVVVPALIIAAVAYLILAFTVKTPFFLIAGALFGLSMGMILPAFNAEAVHNASPYRRGVASATYLLFMDAGFGLGSVLNGLLIDHFGFQTMYFFAAACSLFTIGVCLALMGKRRKSVVLEDRNAVNF